MEEKKITAQEENVLAASEYAYEAIPDGAKKSAWSMVIVLAGYLIAMSNFVTGAAVGYKMTFGDAVKALCVSDIYLVFICIAMGLIAFKFGITTTVMSRKVLGKKGSLVLSVICRCLLSAGWEPMGIRLLNDCCSLSHMAHTRWHYCRDSDVCMAAVCLPGIQRTGGGKYAGGTCCNPALYLGCHGGI